MEHLTVDDEPRSYLLRSQAVFRAVDAIDLGSARSATDREARAWLDEILTAAHSVVDSNLPSCAAP
eukprot:4418355-Pleurochrysis_carterae.AAC.1